MFAELLGWFKLRQQIPNLPTSVSYWIITGLMILAGGVMVVAYLRSNVPLNPLLSINIGAATPLEAVKKSAHHSLTVVALKRRFVFAMGYRAATVRERSCLRFLHSFVVIGSVVTQAPPVDPGKVN